MKKSLKLKIISVCTILTMIIMFYGCKPDNTGMLTASPSNTGGNISATKAESTFINNKTSEPGSTAPVEQISDEFSDNNRTNMNNSGWFAEDDRYVFYRNAYDNGNLYRLDKDTAEKIKLLELPWGELYEINVTDDKIFFQCDDLESGKFGSSLRIYSMNKDGTDLTKVVSNIFGIGYAVKNGYIFYTGTDNTGHFKLYIYSLGSGNSEILIDGDFMTESININIPGDKLYLAEKGVGLDVVEFNLLTNAEKILLTSKAQTGIQKANSTPNLNYYDNAIYYTEGTSIMKFNIGENTIEKISAGPTLERGKIISLVVSRAGVYFIAESANSDPKLNKYYLYNGNYTKAILVTEIQNTHEPKLAIINSHIIVEGDGYIKSYLTNGSEVNIGF